MTDPQQPYFDVIVVGAGNAALCAALAARERGASVAVLEKAPASEQGGNCPYTGGGFRFVHNGIGDLRPLLPDLTDDEAGRIEMAPYTSDDFRNHLTTVTHGDTRTDLMDTLIAQSRPTIDWMTAQGVRWDIYSRLSAIVGAPSVIPNSVGLTAWESGPGLINMLTTSCRRAGISVLYETEMSGVTQDDSGVVVGVVARDNDETYRIRSKAVILACGGFEANAEMRGKHIGSGWELAKVRGSRHNTGDGHRAAMTIGAQPIGQWDGCHGTPIDIDAPATGDIQVTDQMPRRSYTLGISVNLKGKRFVDEGEGFAEQTFVSMGRAILRQENGIAIQIFDSKARPHLEGRYGGSQKFEADTISQLAEQIGVDAATLAATMDAYNEQAHDGEYHPRELDGRSTNDVKPPKSNWAIRIDKPPFSAFTVTGGITYTYGGLKIDTNSRVLDSGDSPIAGLYAAGEIVGGIFYHNSLRAAGLMHGAVFGKIAGEQAARI